MKNIDPKLSKTGLGMCIRRLDQFLWPFEFSSKTQKSHFLAKNGVFGTFWVLTTWTTGTLKFDPDVVETF